MGRKEAEERERESGEGEELRKEEGVERKTREERRGGGAPTPMPKTAVLPKNLREGRTTGGGGQGPGPPWELKNTIFSGFLPLNYVICIFEVCFFSFLLCGRTEEACSMVNGLRKVDF